MTKPPRSVRFTLGFVLFNVALWLAFGVLVVAGFHPSYPFGSPLRFLMASLAFLAAAALVFLSAMLRRKEKWAYFLIICAFAFIIALTIADEVGIVDLIVLVIEVIPLVFLIRERSWFLGNEG